MDGPRGPSIYVCALKQESSVVRRLTSGASLLFASTHLGVEGISQRVAYEVPAEHEEHQGYAWINHDVPVGAEARYPVTGEADELPPVGVTSRRSELQEAERRERQHISADVQRRHDHN